MNEEELRQLLLDGLGDASVEMVVDGSHLSLKLIADVFEGLNRLKRQQLVNGLLKEKIASGEVHAVSMNCLTSDEANS